MSDEIMKELREIYEKINDVAEDVAEMRGVLNSTLPKLATEDQVRSIVTGHEIDCIEKRDKKKKTDAKIHVPISQEISKDKLRYAIGSMLMGGGALIGWLLEKFVF